MLLAVVAANVTFAQSPGGTGYDVTGVDVDVSGPDPVQARAQGIREARRKAFGLLIERLVPAEDRARLPQVDDAQLESMVRGIEFMRERPAPGRYSATLNVVFVPASVKSYLSGAGARVVETVPRPALVIPLWKGPAGLEPLNDRNAWREAWQQLNSAGSAVPVTLIRGDPTDQGALSPEEAFVGDVSALARLNQRYRAPTIVVATIEGDKSGGGLTVTGLRYDTQTGARSEIPPIPVASAADLPAAVKAIHAKADQDWRSIGTVRRDSQDSLDVVVPIQALGDWVRVRQRLGAIPAVKSVTVKTLESDRAELRLDFFGSPEELQRTLAQAGLTLSQDMGRWQLQPR
ncbi:MAG: DUF2066 domain-containing protein [Reyranella sp.]|nr:DUF2066 domain-containing protein [Reyranella sp.]